MNKNKKAQTSIELLVISGFAALILTILIIYANKTMAEDQQQIDEKIFSATTSRIINTIESVGRINGNSKIVNEISFPSGFSSWQISGKEHIFKIRINGREQEIVKVSSFDVYIKNQTGQFTNRIDNLNGKKYRVSFSSAENGSIVVSFE